MANVSVRARDIVGFARKNGITLARGGTGSNNRACARSVLCIMALGPKRDENDVVKWYIRSDSTIKAIGLTNDQLCSLENGFEGATFEKPTKFSKRYYEVGRRVARLAKLA